MRSILFPLLLVHILGIQLFYSRLIPIWGKGGAVTRVSLKHHKVYCCYQDLAGFFFFFFESISLVVAGFCLVFRVLRKLILTVFATFFIAIIKGWNLEFLILSFNWPHFDTTYYGNVNLHHLVKVVSARFLHRKVSIFSLPFIIPGVGKLWLQVQIQPTPSFYK